MCKATLRLDSSSADASTSTGREHSSSTPSRVGAEAVSARLTPHEAPRGLHSQLSGCVKEVYYKHVAPPPVSAVSTLTSEALRRPRALGSRRQRTLGGNAL